MEREQIKPLKILPSDIQKKWVLRGKSIFFHFGINTFTGKEWGDGTEDLSLFNPEQLDCRQWIRTIKNAGFQMAILTAKHHDGFCLWPTAYTEFSVKNTPYKEGKGDIVREFVDACHEYGIEAGLYVSPWDRNAESWGTPEYNEYYINQLKELLTNYGKISECWWDGAGSENAQYDFARWVSVVRNLQPECAIFSSGKGMKYTDCRWAGNERGCVKNPCWATVKPENLREGDPDGTIFMPAEADVSCRPGWFYHDYQDKYSKTPEQIFYLWFNSCGKNATLLYNVPPDKRGLLSDVDVKNILGFQNLMKRSFAVNLAYDAVITADSVNEYYSPYNMLLEDRNIFYAASHKNITPHITFKLPEERVINCFKMSENIDLGYRIRRYQVLARQGDDWKLLCEQECVGACSAEYFDEIRTDEIQLKIVEAIDVPVITAFGIYCLERKPVSSETKYEDSCNLVENSQVTVDNDVITINLGGIYAYNTVIFDGIGIEEYEIYTFNGARWDFEMRGEKPSAKQICNIRNVTWSYMLKLVIIRGQYSHNTVEVYYKVR